MNKIFNKTILALSILVICITQSSCDDFLDRQEDEKLTFDKIWESGPETRNYWYGTMAFINSELKSILGDGNAWLGASDEATVTYDRGYRSINFGTWNPTNIPYSGSEHHDYYYKGIRECNIFLANIGRLSDPTVEQDEIDMMIAHARFARAYYYFNMLRIYGPVYLLGDDIVDFSSSAQDLARPRSTWDDCVNYVVSELEACASLPGIKDGWNGDTEKGLVTKGACHALIARLKLYSARDLFNGNTLYRDVKNPTTDKYPELSGATLFPQEYKAEKWLEAAKAAYKVIENPIYKLYRAGNKDPYEDYYGVSQITWNSELIWTTGYEGRYNISVVLVPTGIAGTAYGGIGPTQQQVDAYAMSNGKYPITGYTDNGATPLIDPAAGYNANEFEKTSWNYPKWGGTNSYSVKTPNMYKDREPRFYVNVFWGDSYWHHGANKTLISYAKGANGNKSHDYPKSGYAINRWYDHTANSASGNWGNITFPTIRLAEMYLNFIESVLECKKRDVALPANYETKAMELWADLRDRAGLKPITEVYPGSSTAQLIELCRKERRIELSFENHRYFDTRTWMIAEQTDGGPMYGMNTAVPSTGNVTPDEFWQRTVFETRVFKKNHYLYPWSQREIERNHLLTQNYGW